MLVGRERLDILRALELAQEMEAAIRNAKSLRGTETVVHKVTAKRVSQVACYRCGCSNHELKDCRFRNAICHFCNKQDTSLPPAGTSSSKGQAENHISPQPPNRRRSQPSMFRPKTRKRSPLTRNSMLLVSPRHDHFAPRCR